MGDASRKSIYGEVILTQPLRVHVIAGGLFLAITVIALWVTLGTYSRTETARGMLTTEIASAKIVAARPGQVVELLVDEADFVRAGQKLAVIRTEQVDEGGGSTVADSLAAVESQRLLALQQVMLANRRAAGERDRLAATLTILREQRAELDTQISLQGESVASAGDMFERASRLIDSGFVSRIELERRRQLYITARLEHARLKQQRSATLAEGVRARAELAKVATEADTEIVSARNAAESLAQQRARLRSERAYTLVAPITGRVSSIQTGLGRTTEATVPLMEIVPEGTSLTAHVYASTRAIGFIQAGQEVRLLYDAFPYQRFGSFGGRIVRVSRTVIDPRQLSSPLGIEEPVYRIEVAPDDQAVAAYGQRLSLQPGMTLTANLILERNSFLDWLLTPINAVMRRAGRQA